MAKVSTQASVPLDCYIAGPGDTGFEHLFARCTAGDIEPPTADPAQLTYRTNATTATYLRDSNSTSAKSSPAALNW